MLINYTYEKAFKVFTLWLYKTLLCPTGKEALQPLPLRVETRPITPAFKPQRMVQNFTLVFEEFASSRNRPGNDATQTADIASFNLCEDGISNGYSGSVFRNGGSG